MMDLRDTVEAEPSQRAGRNAFRDMKATRSFGPPIVPRAIQFEQHAGVRPMHPMTILAKAYRENGFETGLQKLKTHLNENIPTSRSTMPVTD